MSGVRAATANPVPSLPTAASALTAVVAAPALVSASPPPSREPAGSDTRVVVPDWEALWARAGDEGSRIEEG